MVWVFVSVIWSATSLSLGVWICVVGGEKEEDSCRGGGVRY